MTTAVTRNRIVRDVCRSAGWDPWFTYSDKRKTDRRVSFASAGWPVPQKMKNRILRGVKRKLKANNVPHNDVYWYPAESYRGPYDKLVIEVPL